ncbi:hypothetical protein [Vibrio diazotrophicus]|uniref:hypothetical protein n=1 Tax=Vibrio diazotrophicus TaxID=685 RepID=UPI0005A8D809|nr:hypothetical protein [Vibrio diazotrophicus]
MLNQTQQTEQAKVQSESAGRCHENGSKLMMTIVAPSRQLDDSARPAKTFQDELLAMDYAQNGDELLEVFEDGSIYRSTRGADSGAEWGINIAESYLYSGLPMDKQNIMDMCFHEDTEAAKAFVDSLVDYVIECHEEREGEL